MGKTISVIRTLPNRGGNSQIIGKQIVRERGWEMNNVHLCIRLHELDCGSREMTMGFLIQVRRAWAIGSFLLSKLVSIE